MNDVKPVEDRVSGVIGQLFVENAKLGYQLEIAHRQLQNEAERANTLTVELQQTKDALTAEIRRADSAEAALNQYREATIRAEEVE